MINIPKEAYENEYLMQIIVEIERNMCNLLIARCGGTLDELKHEEGMKALPNVIASFC